MTRLLPLSVLIVVVAAAAPATSPDGVAVVELFTSEGCSSCPPADRLLSDFVDEAARRDFRIYALAFHVDSWDRLGWRDRFADAGFSDRQREYATRLGERRISTPQVVVNGRVSMVGSDRSAVRRAVGQALQRPAEVAIDLTIEEIAPTHLEIAVTASASPNPVLVQIAVVESDLVSEVTAGENRGRELHHDNVVRCFATVRPKQRRARVTLSLPGDLALGRSTVIAFAQNPETLAISGATSIPLTDQR